MDDNLKDPFYCSCVGQVKRTSDIDSYLSFYN